MNKAIEQQIEVSDEELMAGVLKRDEQALTVLYNRYSERLLYYFFRLLRGDKEQAQDLLQETFVRVIEKAHLFDPKRKFSTWLFTIGSNLAKNSFRNKAVRMKFEGQIDREIVDPETIMETVNEKIDNAILKRALYREIDKIKPERREILFLRFREGFSIREIHEITGLSEGTVKSRLFYMVRRLASKLEKYQ